MRLILGFPVPCCQQSLQFLSRACDFLVYVVGIIKPGRVADPEFLKARYSTLGSWITYFQEI